ncbi:MAG: hypothetical protein ABIG44_10955 [Planctomycetota bacterium]
MNCAEFERLIDSHLDSELCGSLRLEFDAHRLRCRRCQLTLAMMESVEHVIISDRPAPELSDDFTAHVMTDVERRRPLSLRLRSTRVAVVAGVLVQAAAVLYLAVLWPSMTPSAPVNTEPTIDVSLTATYDKLDLQTERKEALYDLIVARLEAAGVNVAAEFNQLARYPLALSVPDDMARASTGMAESNPWQGFLRALLPVDSEDVETSPTTTDHYSL